MAEHLWSLYPRCPASSGPRATVNPMKLHMEIKYEIEDDDPQAEEIGMQIVGDEARAFGTTLRDRLAEAGVDIHEFEVKAA
jgi:hypothetical protein